MTNKQIQFILKNIGNYDVNKLIPLTEVSTIVMEGNMNIYPDPFTRFIFRDEKNIGLIEAYRGYVGSDGFPISRSYQTYCSVQNWSEYVEEDIG